MNRITLLVISFMFFFSGISQELHKPITNVYVFNNDVKDVEILIASIKGDKSIVLLTEKDRFSNLLDQLSILKKDYLIASVNVFSHGTSGAFFIGSENLTVETLSKPMQAGSFYRLNTLLEENASFNIFSCETGKGVRGEELYSKLCELSGFKIFMSDDKTGLNGDWALEKKGASNLKHHLDVVFLSKNYKHSLQGIISDYCVSEFASTPFSIQELAYDTVNKEIYGAGDSSNGDKLLRIDNNGVVVDIASSTNKWFDRALYFLPYMSTDIVFVGKSVFFQANGFIHEATDLKSSSISFKTAHTLAGTNVSGFEAGMAVRKGLIYTTDGNKSTNSVWEYNPITAVSKIVVTGLPGGTNDGLEYCEETDKMYFMSSLFGIYEIDIVNNSLVQLVPKSSLLTNQKANFAIDPPGKFAYVRHSGGVAKYNLSTGVGEYVVQGLSSSSQQDLMFAESSGDATHHSLYFADVSILYELRGFSFLLPKLQELSSECEVLLDAPVFVSCGTEIVASTATQFPITKKGATEVLWSYDDGNGNTITQTQLVTIADVTGPVADVEKLGDVTAQCEVTSLIPPTATDNCKGVVKVTHNIQFPITKKGITEVLWSYDDGNGNTTTQIQLIIIKDVTGPVPAVEKLEDVTAQCEVTSLQVPTATDNCGGVVKISNDAQFPIIKKGTTVVVWSYVDIDGNTTNQSQIIRIKDTQGPVVAIADFETIYAECEVTVLDTPIAIDNCTGAITGEHNVSLPISGNGTTTEIIWSFDDGNGNVTKQKQLVIIKDVTAPEVTGELEDIVGQFDVTLTPPNATDNCVGIITATTTDPVHYNGEGTFTTTWVFDDGHGNTSSQTQTVVIGSSVLSHGFSPNDDGINDTWTIDGIESYPNCKIQVFSRSGAKVYEKNGYKNTWDGYSNTGSHKKMMSGVYYFIINFNKNGLEPKTGWLYINY